MGELAIQRERQDDSPEPARQIRLVQKQQRAERLVSGSMRSPDDQRPALRDLAAIDALASIRPRKAAQILNDLTASDDEDIVEAAFGSDGPSVRDS